MIVNDLENMVERTSFTKVITIEDAGDSAVYVFPDTKGFLAGVQKKRNAEKLHRILSRI